jgi:hypothetical protein
MESVLIEKENKEEGDNLNTENLQVKSDNIEEFKMPSKQAINNVIFCTHLLAYVKKCVKFSILEAYKTSSENGSFKTKTIEEVRDMIRDGNFIFEKTANYLNDSWRSFNDKTDGYIEEKFGYIMKFGNFEHESCAFNYVWEFCQMLLIYTMGRIDLPELKDEEFLGSSVEIILDSILSLEVENLLQRDVICGQNCTPYGYKKGEDFIQVMKKILKK